MKRTLLLLLFLMLTQVGWSQQYLNSNYGTNKNEIAQKLVIQSDSTLLLMGSSEGHAFVLYKIKTNGDTIFNRKLKLPFFTLSTDMVSCPNGDIILIGFYGGIVKIDQNGKLLWIINNDIIDQRAAVLINDTTFAVAGSKPIFSHMEMIPDLGLDSIFIPRIHVALYHTSGKFLKEQIYSFGSDYVESATDILFSSRGTLEIDGYTYADNGYPNNFLLTVTPDLIKLQDSLLTHPGIYIGNAMIENEKGNFVSCGSKLTNAVNDDDIFIQERNAAGGIIWEKTYNFKGSEVGTALFQSEGNYYVTGNITNKRNTSPKSAEIMLLKLDSAGDTVWTKIYTLPDFQYAADIKELNDSMLVILGYTSYNTCSNPSPNTSCANYDFYIMYVNKETGYSNLYPQKPQPILSKEVVVYPNPSNGILKIKGEGIKSVIVTNSVGKVIKTWQNNEAGQEVEISGLEKGIYFLLVETEKGFEKKRVVIM